MITLYQYAPRIGLRSPNPFCTKVENFLRIARLDFRSEAFPFPEQVKGKQLPLLVDDDQLLDISAEMLSYLTETYELELDTHLTKQNATTALILIHLLEDNLYWCLIHNLWVRDESWDATRNAFFGHLSAVKRYVRAGSVRRQMKRQPAAHKVGKLSRDEVDQLSFSSMKTLSGLLADHRFIMGDQISSYDAIAHAFLSCILMTPLETSVSDSAREHSNLVRYCDRMQDYIYGT